MPQKHRVHQAQHVTIFMRAAGSFLLAVALGGWPNGSLRGEDEPPNRPDDGAWVRYQFVAGYKGEKEDSSMTVTLSLVGTTDDDGVRCRWIEIKTVMEEPAELAGTAIVKLLLPEKDLLESASPFAHIRRHWRRVRGEPVKEGPLLVDAASYENLLLWMPSMLKGSEPVEAEAKDIDFQRGQLKNAQARTGEHVYKRPGPGKTEIRRVIKYTVWQHPDVRFGFAEAKLLGDRFYGNTKFKQVTSLYRIQDTGTGAKSELPDNN
jgi:hypothetical protein